MKKLKGDLRIQKEMKGKEMIEGWKESLLSPEAGWGWWGLS